MKYRFRCYDKANNLEGLVNINQALNYETQKELKKLHSQKKCAISIEYKYL